MDKRRRPRCDRRLTDAQVQEIRTSQLSCPAMARLLFDRDGVKQSHVAIWKIRHQELYRELPPELEK
jgi:hypothetical protein